MLHQTTDSSCEALSPDERAVLKTIFRQRLRLFLLVFGVVLLIAFLAASTIDSPASRFSGSNHRHIYKPDDSNFHISRKMMHVISFCFLGGIVLIVFISIFRKRVWCFYKDLRYNNKEVIYYEVMRKQRFEHTNQFFLGLNDPDYLFHEVDEQTWLQVQAGDAFPVYRAPFSKYAFHLHGKYTIM